MLLAMVLFMPIVSYSIEGNDTYEPSEWRCRRLERLLDESKWPTCNEYNREIRDFKREFAEKYLEKYQDQQEILKDLSKETQGIIRTTVDPELAEKDPNKFLCLDPLKCTPDEIDARWKRIHHAGCKNMSSKNTTEIKS